MLALFWFFLLFFFPLQALELYDQQSRLKPSTIELLELFQIPSYLPPQQIRSLLQQNFLQTGKEYWEMDTRFEENKAEALPLLKKIGCIDSIYPSQRHYKYAMILGARGNTMQRRLDFLYQEWEKGLRFDTFVLLTGQRPLNPSIESFPENLSSETDLLLYLFQKHPLKNTAPFILIDSSKEKLTNLKEQRTGSTIRDWLLTNPQEGKCLFISSQPSLGYQEAVARFFLPTTFKVEIAGPSLEESSSCSMAIYLETFTKWFTYESLKRFE